MPQAVYFDDHRLPASYTNFYIANGVVVVPQFACPADAAAVETLAAAFPSRRIVGIRAVELAWGLGTFHCITQQQPRGRDGLTLCEVSHTLPCFCAQAAERAGSANWFACLRRRNVEGITYKPTANWRSLRYGARCSPSPRPSPARGEGVYVNAPAEAAYDSTNSSAASRITWMSASTPVHSLKPIAPWLTIMPTPSRVLKPFCWLLRTR